MAHIGEPWAGLLGRDLASFSPDGRQFVVVVRRGNLAANVNNYSLLGFLTDRALRHPAPRILVSMPSASNYPGISDVRWLSNETLVFLEARNEQPRQIAALNFDSGELRRITNHPMDVLAFNATPGLETIVFIARPVLASFWNDQTKREGLVVSRQYVGDLLVGHPWEGDDAGVITALEVYVKREGEPVQRVDTASYRPHGTISVSPDGRSAIVRAWVRKGALLPEWSVFKAQMAPDLEASIYLVIDTMARTVRALFDAPVAEYRFSNLAWTSSNTVLVANTYLPIGETLGGDPEERFTAEVDISTSQITKVSRGSHRLISWDSATNVLCIRALHQGIGASAAHACDAEDLALEKVGSQWKRRQSERRPARARLEATIEQGMNVAPKLRVRDPATRREAVLLDPNPEFRDLRFARVEEIEWQSDDGETFRGGLYYPVDYVRKRRYPLVIQTHGWDGKLFLPDGVSSAGYAAQALAGRGFFVAQLPDAEKWEGTAEEGPRYLEMHEKVIDMLDQRGLIDTDRLGISGWSRTGYHVRHTVTFSRFRFAAAAVADGMDASYGQYLSYLNLGSEAVDVYEALNGAAPFGDGLQLWLERATGFNLHRVNTPIRLITFTTPVLLNNWEWFAGLRHQGKPVELVWLHRAAHDPVRPSDRWVAQEGNVDWFDFWLNGREDGAPEKVEQYLRWRALRSRRP